MISSGQLITRWDIAAIHERLRVQQRNVRMGAACSCDEDNDALPKLGDSANDVFDDSPDLGPRSSSESPQMKALRIPETPTSPPHPPPGSGRLGAELKMRQMAPGVFLGNRTAAEGR